MCIHTKRQGIRRKFLIIILYPLQNLNWFDFRMKAKSIFNVLKSTNLHSIVQHTVITTSTSFSLQTFTAESFKKMRHSYCLGLYNCQVKDISALVSSDLRLYELSIWNKRSKSENARWRKVKALIYHYYRLDSPKK